MGLMTLRQANASWRPILRKHLLALDADDRYGRFGVIASDALVKAYVAGIDFRSDVCVVASDCDDHCFGLVHLALFDGVAELGLSVQEDCRRHGLGQQLFAAALQHAYFRGIAEIHLATAPRSVLRMCHRLGTPYVLLSQAYPRGTVKTSAKSEVLVEQVLRGADESSFPLRQPLLA